MDIPVRLFTPLQIKMAVTGYGVAEKHQVQEMVKLLLKLDKVPSPDHAADSLAAAICFAANSQTEGRLKFGSGVEMIMQSSVNWSKPECTARSFGPAAGGIRSIGVGTSSIAPFEPPRDARRQVRILTWLQHREDGMTLYGFTDEDERMLFLELNKVSGIGPRQALKILSAVQVRAFVKALDDNDVDYLSSIPASGLRLHKNHPRIA
jgi:hypothetical protein